ncbi:MAG: uncharacterized protein A8A55_1996 [Amphiamblys sp. WSBS2006]|nr:MAG: uncharacterized protein A8A55_1996 [Amphiamblys sp. WSBS2006]
MEELKTVSKDILETVAELVQEKTPFKAAFLAQKILEVKEQPALRYIVARLARCLLSEDDKIKAAFAIVLAAIREKHPEVTQESFLAAGLPVFKEEKSENSFARKNIWRSLLAFYLSFGALRIEKLDDTTLFTFLDDMVEIARKVPQSNNSVFLLLSNLPGKSRRVAEEYLREKTKTNGKFSLGTVPPAVLAYTIGSHASEYLQEGNLPVFARLARNTEETGRLSRIWEVVLGEMKDSEGGLVTRKKLFDSLTGSRSKSTLYFFSWITKNSDNPTLLCTAGLAQSLSLVTKEEKSLFENIVDEIVRRIEKDSKKALLVLTALLGLIGTKAETDLVSFLKNEASRVFFEFVCEEFLSEKNTGKTGECLKMISKKSKEMFVNVATFYFNTAKSKGVSLLLRRHAVQKLEQCYTEAIVYLFRTAEDTQAAFDRVMELFLLFEESPGPMWENKAVEFIRGSLRFRKTLYKHFSEEQTGKIDGVEEIQPERIERQLRKCRKAVDDVSYFEKITRKLIGERKRFNTAVVKRAYLLLDKDTLQSDRLVYLRQDSALSDFVFKNIQLDPESISAVFSAYLEKIEAGDEAPLCFSIEQLGGLSPEYTPKCLDGIERNAEHVMGNRNLLLCFIAICKNASKEVMEKCCSVYTAICTDALSDMKNKKGTREAIDTATKTIPDVSCTSLARAVRGSDASPRDKSKLIRLYLGGQRGLKLSEETKEALRECCFEILIGSLNDAVKSGRVFFFSTEIIHSMLRSKIVYKDEKRKEELLEIKKGLGKESLKRNLHSLDRLLSVL